MARILTAAVLIPLVILLLFRAPFWLVTVATAAVAILACWEYLGLADGSGADTPRLLVLAGVIALFAINFVRPEMLMAGFSAISWTGMLAPKGTPQPIVDKLSSEMIRATKDPKFLSVLLEAGIDPIAEGPEKFAAMIASELPVWKKAVEIAGVKIAQ